MQARRPHLRARKGILHRHHRVVLALPAGHRRPGHLHAQKRGDRATRQTLRPPTSVQTRLWRQARCEQMSSMEGGPGQLAAGCPHKTQTCSGCLLGVHLPGWQTRSSPGGCGCRPAGPSPGWRCLRAGRGEGSGHGSATRCGSATRPETPAHLARSCAASLPASRPRCTPPLLSQGGTSPCGVRSACRACASGAQTAATARASPPPPPLTLGRGTDAQVRRHVGEHAVAHHAQLAPHLAARLDKPSGALHAAQQGGGLARTQPAARRTAEAVRRH